MLRNISEIYGRFRGHDVFLIGSGKSLDYYPKDFFKYRSTVGLNEVVKHFPCTFTVTPHHEFFPDLLAWPTIFVIPKYKHLLKEQGSPAFEILDDHQETHYYFTHPQNGFGKINHPIGNEQIASAGTCTVLGLEFCRWIGAKTVFLCGIDGVAIDGETNYSAYAGPAVELEGGYIQHIEQTRHLYKVLIDSWNGDGPAVVGLNPFLDFYNIPE